jgi:tetratricopeptide (TPR) repeat protein
MPVSSRGHRKQILLFLLAVILPSLVLVVFTLRMISQEKELAQKREVDERRRLAGEIGQHLLVRLEKVKLQESNAAANWNQLSAQRGYVNSEVVLIGQVEGDRLLLPWEENQKSEEFRQLLSSSNFARKIRNAEKEEFAKKDFLRASELYRQLMKTAQEPVQRGYARLLLARALAKAGRNKEALSHYRRILALPSRVTDEYGIPLSLYAAGLLLDAGVRHGEVLECIRTELGAKHWLSPAEFYMLQEVVERLIKSVPEQSTKDTAKDYQRMVNEHILKLEQALELQGDFQKIAFASEQRDQGKKDEPIWISYGEIPWLVSLAPPLAGSKPLLFVVHAQDIHASLRQDSGFSETFPGEFHFVVGERSEGESLGPNFRGLKIGFAESEDTALSKQWNFQRSFYLLERDAVRSLPPVERCASRCADGGDALPICFQRLS